jgi:predicted flap endonuclease-1-like 5' DNA nuclease
VIKEVEVEKIVEKIVDRPVEVIKEVEVEKIVEKIVEVEKPVEVIKEVEVEKIVEKIVTDEKEVNEWKAKNETANTNLKQVRTEVKELLISLDNMKAKNTKLQEELAKKPKEVIVEKIVEKEIIKEVKVKAKPKNDDLKKIEGIGPKIEGLLNKASITTYKKLYETKQERLKKILTDAGPRYQMHDPSSWNRQGWLAWKGEWMKLAKLQDELDGGRKVSKAKKPVKAKSSKTVAKKPVAKKVTKAKKDDLKKIEGIGPKIEGLLNAAGIKTFEKLYDTKVDVLRAILTKAGPRFQMHDPGTWGRQARLAWKGQWEQLDKLQDELDGGKKAKKVASASAKVTKKPATKKTSATKGKGGSKKDDLKKIEGIGPKIESLLHAGGIKTFEKLSKTKVDVLSKILSKAGPRFQMHDPSTWARQSGLAAKGQWDKLDKLQDELDGGRKK